MGRRPCCAKEGLNRGIWTAGEDKILVDYIQAHGEGKWRDLPQRAGLKRCGKSCRLRWLNYLRPGIKRGNISMDEEELIIRLHNLLGNRWSLIAGRLPGRTDNEIKNHWNTNLSKKVQDQMHKTPVKRSNELEPGSEMSKEESPPGAKPHQVVRTKAIRCTRVILPPSLIDQVASKATSVHNSNSETSSYSSTRQSNSSSHFLADFNIDDLLVSDEAQNLDSCFPLEGEKVDCYPSNFTLSVHDDAQGIRSEGLETWRVHDEPFQPSGSFDFNSLASFLDSEGGYNLDE
ncbi:uncharacterized protein J3R85_018593 [Psidium guajava]|nr:uncharacterized protein J3R85_018593 [Psidium guajava]